MATEETTITELELAEEVLADMVIPVDTSTDTKSVSLKQLRAWLGSSLPTGFILPAVGKMDDARFTLLDGKTLSKQGTYGAFCTKVEEQVQASNWFACTEEEYNADLLAYGQCGKFVIGTDYIRIPTITRFIGATITLSEIGKTYKESLPQHTHTRGTMNITGKFNDGGLEPAGSLGATGAFSRSTDSSGRYYYHADRQGTGQIAINFDASKSWTGSTSNASGTTYQSNAKVQPDHTKYPYYMVISTEGQTAEVGVDINNVYEDMNLKANTNLSNLTAEGKSLVSSLGMPSDRYTDLTLGATGSTYTAPANGYFFISKTSSASGQYLNLYNKTAGWSGYGCNSSASGQQIRLSVPVKKGDEAYISYNMGGSSADYDAFKFIYAEGEK